MSSLRISHHRAALGAAAAADGGRAENADDGASFALALGAAGVAPQQGMTTLLGGQTGGDTADGSLMPRKRGDGHGHGKAGDAATALGLQGSLVAASLALPAPGDAADATAPAAAAAGSAGAVIGQGVPTTPRTTGIWPMLAGPTAAASGATLAPPPTGDVRPMDGQQGAAWSVFRPTQCRAGRYAGRRRAPGGRSAVGCGAAVQRRRDERDPGRQRHAADRHVADCPGRCSGIDTAGGSVRADRACRGGLTGAGGRSECRRRYRRGGSPAGASLAAGPAVRLTPSADMQRSLPPSSAALAQISLPAETAPPGFGGGGFGGDAAGQRDRFAPVAAASGTGDAAAAAIAPGSDGATALAAAPGAASATATNATTAIAISDQIAGHLVRMVSSGPRDMVMHLRPPELGDLTVRVAVNGRDVSAWFVSPQPQVQNAISAALGQLQTSLGDAGYNLSGAWVGADASGAQQQGASPPPLPRGRVAAPAVVMPAAAASARPPVPGLNIYV